MSIERHAGASSLRRRIETVFDARALGRAMFALVPLLLLTLVSGRSEWLTAAIVPVAMLIALDHSQLAPLGVFAHALAISAGFVILMASLAHPLLFVVATVLLGMGSVRERLTQRGLRDLPANSHKAIACHTGMSWRAVVFSASRNQFSYRFNMDTRNLKYFLAVADAGSITHAADCLN
ncbi:MAG TPA: hypothetical protein VKJ77_21210 [Caballeronia sp.]|nr:hypothetical protein [Caballeronia sp.]